MNPTLKIWVQLIGLLAVEVAVIVGIAAQMQRLTGKAAWRRTIWQVCILGLLMLVVFEFTGAARGVFAWSGTKPVAVNPVIAQVAHNDSRISPRRAPLTNQSPANFQSAPSANAMRQTQPSAPGVPVARAASEIPPRKWSDTLAASEFLPLIWLVLVWMAGATIVVGRGLVLRMILEVLRWKHGEIRETDLVKAVKELAGRMGIRRRVRLMESKHVCSPVAFGIIRPTIGLPVCFYEKFNSAQREAMLAHELAHLEGNDPVWYLLADVLTALLWWHPLTWWARRQLHAQSEQAADEASLLVADGPGALAECLVTLGAQLARKRSLMPLPLGVAGGGFRSSLGRRVERLVKLEGTAWRPPNRVRSGLAVMIGPVALVAAAILCTAWVVPPALNKGENMQTMKQTWKKSLAAFALLTALSPDGDRAMAQPASGQPIAANEIVVTAVPLGTNFEQVFVSSDEVSGGTSVALSQPGVAAAGTSGGGSFAASKSVTMSYEQREVEQKLMGITVDSIKYDGLPLFEVVNNLIEISAKHDRNGVNFVLNRETPPGTVPSIDPATGLPMAAAPSADDLNSVTVHINPALKNVRMIDVLDAITKTADRPIHFTIEDYGVLFSFGPKPKEEQRRAMFQDRLSSVVKKAPDGKLSSNPGAAKFLQGFGGGAPALEIMTFKVDTNTFVANIERTFGEKVANDSSKQVRGALIGIFDKNFGIRLDVQGKSIFYNDANGVMMVRGTPEEVATIRGAMEMLGGVPMESRPMSDADRAIESALRTMSNGSGGGGGGAGGSVQPQGTR